MIIYPLMDISGNVLGKIALEDNTVPNLIMNDEEFKLGGAFYPLTKNFMNFILVPKSWPERAGGK